MMGFNGGPVFGPWLNGSGSNRPNDPYRTYGKFAHIIAPTPSLLWVFIDEDENSIDFGSFAVSMKTLTSMVDWPGTYHNYAANLAFADGHGESHKWRDHRTRNTTTKVSMLVNPPMSQAPNNQDIIWLQQRTSALYQ